MIAAENPDRELGFLYAIRQWRGFSGRRVRGTVLRLRLLRHGVYIEPELSVVGPRNMAFGRGVVIQRRAALYARPGSRLTIGDGCRLGSDLVISVAVAVTIGREVLMAPRCYISDHNHEFRNPAIPVIRQGMTAPEPVTISDGTWLGINVCVLAGVELGRNCVVAANSVVTRSFPDGSVVGGAPARLLRSLSSSV